MHKWAIIIAFWAALGISSALGDGASSGQPEVTVSVAPRFETELRVAFGADQAAVLREAVTQEIGRALGPATGDPAKRVNIDVIIEWAKPTHPTPRQLKQEPGLDFLRSKSPGGADLSATLRAPDGRTVGRVEFGYYAPTIHLASQAADAWADARISIQRFAERVAAKVKAVS